MPILAKTDIVKMTRISATDAKNEFGRVLDRVNDGEVVTITRHETERAVIMSMQMFKSLSSSADRALQALSDEFDALVERMQTDEARRAMKAAFDAPPSQLGAAST